MMCWVMSVCVVRIVYVGVYGDVMMWLVGWSCEILVLM